MLCDWIVTLSKKDIELITSWFSQQYFIAKWFKLAMSYKGLYVLLPHYTRDNPLHFVKAEVSEISFMGKPNLSYSQNRRHSGTFEADLIQMNTFICCSTLQFLHFWLKNDKIFPLYTTKTDKVDIRLYFENEEKNSRWRHCHEISKTNV